MRITQTSISFLLMVFFFTSALGQEEKKLEIIHADDLIYDTSKGVKAKRLIGNVAFKQENTFMYCDSAYFYTETNSFEAFDNVRIVEGDSLNLTGNKLDYDGNSKFAKFRGDIVLKDKSMTLTTDNLDYDREGQIAFYFGGGKIINKEDQSTLTSDKGTYFANSELFHFKGDVILISEDYTINSDTLHHQTSTETSYFFGPTTINNDSSNIYCEKGWYNENTGESLFAKNAKIQNDKKILAADSILYNTKIDEGIMHGHVQIIDTVEEVYVFGHYAISFGQDSFSLVTDSAMLIQIFDGDSMFLHGDTLISEFDSTGKRLLRAYDHVKLFKEDFAGKCDSIVFSEGDSLIKMFYNPVVWVEGNELSAKYMQIKHYDGKLRWMDLNENSFIVSEYKPEHYDQINGINMRNYFKEGKLKKVEVKGSGKTIYYASEEDGTEIGVNEASAEDLTILLDSNKIKTIKFYSKPKATITPLEQANIQSMKLPGFNWRFKEKPLKPEDIFLWEEN